MNEQKAVRNSGIELIKVLAVIFIIISHVVLTLHEENTYISYTGYMVNLNLATTDLQTFALVLLRHLGALGNNIFFICSAWFLLESKAVNQKKLLTIILETWSISVMMLVVVSLVKSDGVNWKLAIKSFFPFFFTANWYVGCYVLFYASHTLLNRCIGGVKQAGLLKIATILGTLYCGCNCIHSSFYNSDLIFWIALYFIIAYFKKYLPKLCDNTKMNFLFLAGGMIGNSIAVLATNKLYPLSRTFLKIEFLFWTLDFRGCP